MTGKTDQRCYFETQLKCGKLIEHIRLKYGWFPSTSHTNKYLSIFHLHLPVCRPVVTFVFVLHLFHPISKTPIQSTSPHFSLFTIFNKVYSSFFQSFVFSNFKSDFSRRFPKIIYNVCNEYVVTPTVVRCMVLHVTDSEPSVHVY
jgi:hypothetical protein